MYHVWCDGRGVLGCAEKAALCDPRTPPRPAPPRPTYTSAVPAGTGPGKTPGGRVDGKLFSLDANLFLERHELNKSLTATLLVSALGCVVGAASSVYSGVAPQNAEAFGVSEVAASLVTGIYLLGFAAGSLVSGPPSEVLCRNLVYVSSSTLFIIFVMASALAPNFGAQLAFRFLSGVFGCPPLTCAGGTIADLWNPLEKTMYFPVYAIISFCGPATGPLIASYIGKTDVLSWRWAGWVVTIMSGAVLVLIIFFQPETYSPLRLSWRAKHLRPVIGDRRFCCEMDTDHISLVHRFGRAMRN
ncbi:hypothetical protein MAC_09636 [Metarhizium acridum CQMa 102]|uniref:Major facilitator superfamily (MFS) profile domain-containing protein n=1 Tax=Metarhizium acridum (strain CQMa 102) TaxID=655827 RepID=E9EID8_METAQ|nr:uncharacterized protein MAC_09636 [Metarhizium acridum CQMa 102]EFY84313.1 hypothetical protein MAC_09636 [Metarhizium acridum CQMa 102]